MAKRGCDIAAEIASLTALDLHMLRQRWMECYGVEPGNRISRQMLIQAIACKLQADALGGLGKTTQRKLARLAAELRRDGQINAGRSQTASTGTRLIREWKGKTHEVQVTGDGYVWEGRRYRSLSQIARAITGTRWSGPRFFGLDADGQSSPKAMPMDPGGDQRPPPRSKRQAKPLTKQQKRIQQTPVKQTIEHAMMEAIHG